MSSDRRLIFAPRPGFERRLQEQPERAAAYRRAVVREEAGGVWLDEALVRAISGGIRPVPKSEWPWYAKLASRLKTAADRGVGDTVERCLGVAGTGYKRAFAALMERPCGCTDRQAWLNASYPYGEAQLGLG